VGRIDDRLRRLEQAYGDPCPECGWDGAPESLEYTVGFGQRAQMVPGIENPEEVPPEESKYCAACGRAIKIVLTWGDRVGKKLADRRTR
jgi:hypothetical protein